MKLRNFMSKRLKRLSNLTRSTFIRPKPKLEPYPHKPEHEVPCDINLGTDHSIIEPPRFIIEGLDYAINHNLNQYTRFMGYIPLCEKIAEIYGEKLNRNIKPLEEILATLGSTGAFNTIIWNILRKGDEVVVFEPFYYPWMAALRQRGVKVKTVPIKNGSFEQADLLAAVNKNTRLIVVDNPSFSDGYEMNPLSLTKIADVVLNNPDLYVISNESLHLQTKIYDLHLSLGSIPGMFDRTFTVYSGGFEFDCRGYRVGWIIAPAEYLAHFGTYQSYDIYSPNTPAMVI